MDTCYKIHGYPTGFKHKVKQQSEKHQYNKTSGSAKPFIAQLNFNVASSNVLNNLTKDKTYFNSQIIPALAQLSCVSTSGGTITARPGMNLCHLRYVLLTC